jgi:hypothetical protein
MARSPLSLRVPLCHVVHHAYPISGHPIPVALPPDVSCASTARCPNILPRDLQAQIPRRCRWRASPPRSSVLVCGPTRAPARRRRDRPARRAIPPAMPVCLLAQGRRDERYIPDDTNAHLNAVCLLSCGDRSLMSARAAQPLDTCRVDQTVKIYLRSSLHGRSHPDPLMDLHKRWLLASTIASQHSVVDPRSSLNARELRIRDAFSPAAGRKHRPPSTPGRSTRG